MIRRAFLSSKSNTAAGEIVLKHACQKLGKIDHKNGDCSKSVNSFHSGAIFPPSLGHELSRNAFVASILSFWKNRYIDIGQGYEPKSSKFSKNALSERVARFGRPCRGLRTLTGLRPELVVRHADDLHDS